MKINRSTYLGGSDAAAILGLDRWRSRHDVYLAKVGEGTPIEPNEAMAWGTAFEAPIRAEYRRRTGRNVRPGVVRHPEHPFIRGHVDGKGDALLEVKLVRDDRDWGEDGDGSITAIPAYYRPQIVHYMLAAGATRIDVAALMRGMELRIYPDIPLPSWAGELLAEEVDFWTGHVVPRIPPELDGSEGAGRMLAKRFPRDNGSELIALPEQYPLLEELRLARQNADQVEREKNRLEQLIKDAMGEASYLLAPGLKISWKRAKDGQSVAWDLYAESLEKLLREVAPGEESTIATLKSLYTSVKQGQRRFLVKYDEPTEGRIE